VYAANSGGSSIVSPDSDSVSVIATATNPANDTVAATVGVGSNPADVGIMAQEPFATFSAGLQVGLSKNPAQDTFALQSSFTLKSGTSISPLTQLIMLTIGPYSVSFPPFRQGPGGSYTFDGVINGVNLNAVIAPTGTLSYAFDAWATGANLTGIVNPVPVTLTIGEDTGTASVIFH
jgi:hypothetical protein